MTAYKYLLCVMDKLATLLFNASQNATKDDILDAIKDILIRCNNVVDERDRVKIIDYRNKK